MIAFKAFVLSTKGALLICAAFQLVSCSLSKRYFPPSTFPEASAEDYGEFLKHFDEKPIQQYAGAVYRYLLMDFSGGPHTVVRISNDASGVTSLTLKVWGDGGYEEDVRQISQESWNELLEVIYREAFWLSTENGRYNFATATLPWMLKHEGAYLVYGAESAKIEMLEGYQFRWLYHAVDRRDSENLAVTSVGAHMLVMAGVKRTQE